MAGKDVSKIDGHVDNKAATITMAAVAPLDILNPEDPEVGFYDPSKESIWTRAGLNLESYKRAPGATGGIIMAGTRDDAVLGGGKVENPMLQQKMKVCVPKHSRLTWLLTVTTPNFRPL